MLKCELCGRTFSRSCDLSAHISKEHSSISKKDYYDLYLKKEDGEGICPTCGKAVKFLGLTGYATYCCRACADASPKKKEKCRATWNKNNTAESVSAKIKQTKLDRYGDANYNNSQKHRETCLQRYGVSNASKNNAVKSKIKQTKQDKYANSNYNNSERIKETQTRLYGGYAFTNTEKVQTTLLTKYGVTNCMQLPECKEKVSLANSLNAQERLNKSKQTCIQKYGVEYPTQTKQVQEKIKQTNLNRYGVPSYSQSTEFHKKKLSKYFYNKLIFDSSYELCYYKYCLAHRIEIDRSTDVFEYNYEGTTHYYFPDFKVNGVNVEIKGSHFFEDGKMINPFDRTQDGLYEAKHQCMLRNNVQIITDCTEYIEFVTLSNPNFLSLCSLDRTINTNYLSWKKLTDGPQRCTDISKTANGPVLYEREISLWNTSSREFKAELFKNRLKYLNKNPDQLTNLEIIRGLHISGKIRAYSTFNNSGMKAFIQKYNINSIYDPCAGWGERLVTCAALDIIYYGVDINKKVIDGHNKIIQHYNLTNQTSVCKDSSIYVNTNQVDCAFTCPPYWKEEIYTEKGAENLSYDDFLSWWKQAIINCNVTLFAYQINQKYKTDMNKVLLDLGYEFQEEIPLISRSSHFTRKKDGVNKKKEYEAIQVFKKKGY